MPMHAVLRELHDNMIVTRVACGETFTALIVTVVYSDGMQLGRAEEVWLLGSGAIASHTERINPHMIRRYTLPVGCSVREIVSSSQSLLILLTDGQLLQHGLGKEMALMPTASRTVEIAASSTKFAFID